jgi:hypothetical protein
MDTDEHRSFRVVLAAIGGIALLFDLPGFVLNSITAFFGVEKRKIHHGDTEGTEKIRQRRSLPIRCLSLPQKKNSRFCFSVLSVSPW